MIHALEAAINCLMSAPFPQRSMLATAGLLFIAVVTLSADAANVCRVGSISLSQMAATTFVDGTTAYTLGYCNGATQPTSTSLSACATAGYITTHSTTTGGCTVSYPTVVADITEGTNNVTYTVASSSGSNVAVVTVVCDSTMIDMTSSSLDTPVATTTSGTVTTSFFTVRSKSACPVSSYFCSSTQYCSDSTKSCIEGVCIDASCVTMSLESNNASTTFVATSPANFLSQFAVTDCHGTPVAGLNMSYFNITVEGKAITDPSLIDEGDYLFQSSPDDFSSPATRPQITTILLDQSMSVRLNYESTLKDAAINLTTRIMSSVNATSGLRVQRGNNYVAILLIDGSASATVLQTHTTDMDAVLNAINSLPISTPDPQSTNLYGGIVSGLQEAYRMKLMLNQNTASSSSTVLFDNTSNIFSSLILFTDGYDTSARTSRAAALNEAVDVGSQVAVLTVGVANSSDTALLEAIATTGYATSVGNDTSTIGEAFDEIAQRLELLSQNHYRFLFCVPFRNSGADVVIELNRTTFPLSTTASVAAQQTLTMTFDASAFTSGCSTASLLSGASSSFDVQSTGSNTNSTLVNYVTLSSDAVLTNTIPASGAYYFQFTPSAAAASRRFVGMGVVDDPLPLMRELFNPQAAGSQLITVSPTGTVAYYLNSTETASSSGLYTFRCIVSIYCYDGTFSSTFVPDASRMYRVMAANSNTGSSVFFTVSSQTYVSTAASTTVGTISPTTITSTSADESRLSFGVTSTNQQL